MATAALAAEPGGVLAASCGDQVVLVDPVQGRTAAFDTGQVGWLYPAPGAVVFAPDLINAHTTVISTAPPAVLERLDGVTMPLFGSLSDRYVVAGPGRVLMVAYPGKAIISRREVDIGAPWRSLLDAEGRFLFVIEQGGSGKPGAITAVDAIGGSVGARAPIDGPVTDAVLVADPPTVALAGRTSPAIRLRPAETLTPALIIQAGGEVAGLATCRERWLVAAVREGDQGRLQLWKLRGGRGGIRVKPKDVVQLPRAPLDVVVSPDGEWIAVAVDGPELLILQWKKDDVILRTPLPAPPRDVVWTDPTRPAPTWPEWSDRQ